MQAQLGPFLEARGQRLLQRTSEKSFFFETVWESEADTKSEPRGRARRCLGPRSAASWRRKRPVEKSSALFQTVSPRTPTNRPQITRPPARNVASSASSQAAYRGARQKLPGSPTRSPCVSLPLTRVIRVHKPNFSHPWSHDARQGVPGCPTKTTGVPDKEYRGARQKLPGCPTSLSH